MGMCHGGAFCRPIPKFLGTRSHGVRSGKMQKAAGLGIIKYHYCRDVAVQRLYVDFYQNSVLRAAARAAPTEPNREILAGEKCFAPAFALAR